jgi:hypothetical protein
MALVAACLAGAGAVVAWNALALYPRFEPLGDHRDLTKAANLSDAELARVLMDRVAPTFVASDRRDASFSGVRFFTAPTPFGGNLCRVDIVSFPAQVVRGQVRRGDRQWGADNISLETTYGVWTTDAAIDVAARNAARDVACANYHDFQRLIRGDGLAIERVINVLAKAKAAFKAGRADFTVGCGAPPPAKITRCAVSKAAVLKLDAADIGEANAISETMGQGSSAFVDRVTTRAHPDGHGCIDFGVYRIESRQTWGTESEADPDLVDLEFLPGGPAC